MISFVTCLDAKNVLHGRGEFVVGKGVDIMHLTWAEGTTEFTAKTIASVDGDRPGETRLNDAKCDPRGRLFAGTMGVENPLKPAVIEPKRGSLYRIDHRGVKKVLPDVNLSNGLCWTQGM